MKETAYIEKMAMYQKRKKTAVNRVNSLEKEIKEQENIIKKADGDMLCLCMEHGHFSVENVVDMLNEKSREKKQAEEQRSAEQAEKENITMNYNIGGKTNEY